MTRALSGAALIAFAVAVVWFAPVPLFVVVAELLLVLAVVEYAGLARASGLVVPVWPVGVAAALASIAVGGVHWGLTAPIGLGVVLMAATLALGSLAMAGWREGPDALASVAAATLPMLYLGLPIGAMIAIREARGAEGLFLLMLTVSASDTAQYYTGRAFGRRRLAPAISPGKTIEGAMGGFLVGPVVLAVVGFWWLPDVAWPVRTALGFMVVVMGVTGDLFESMLKRSAGVKDSSSLIPGHGGVLDRIDALLFAAPVYYLLLVFA